MKFLMPFDTELEIKPSKDICECSIAYDEEIDGIVYNIFWGQKIFPLHMKTKGEATSIAIGLQWAAKEMYQRIMNDDR
jgi:hypothetical protein